MKDTLQTKMSGTWLRILRTSRERVVPCAAGHGLMWASQAPDTGFSVPCGKQHLLEDTSSSHARILCALS